MIASEVDALWHMTPADIVTDSLALLADVLNDAPAQDVWAFHYFPDGHLSMVGPLDALNAMVAHMVLRGVIATALTTVVPWRVSSTEGAQTPLRVYENADGQS